MGATCAIIPASGLGRRLGSHLDKAFVSIAGQPLLAHTLNAFQECPDVDEIVVVVQGERVPEAEALVRERGFSKVSSVTPGGDTRQDSVRNGLARIAPDCEIVAIHDGARPLVTREIISSTIEAARSDRAVIAAVPVIDTVKTAPDGRFISSTLDREKLYAVQTPQTFARDVIESAYERAYADHYVGTDDASLVERLGIPVRIVEGSYENIKITTPTDILIAEAIMARRISDSSAVASAKADFGFRISSFPPARIGHGYDVHRFAPGRKLILGGVEFPGEEGLLGHSDADVMLHAAADAVLGAAGAGDIGRHFPDTDPAYKDISSLMLLARTAKIAEEFGWRVANLDITLIAERPRIAAHVSHMRANIAEALGIGLERVNVKGSTAEGLGPVGEGLGIECHAVALVVPL